MSLRSEAVNILEFIDEHPFADTNYISKKLKMDKKRVLLAIQYLYDKKFVYIKQFGQDYYGKISITARGNHFLTRKKVINKPKIEQTIQDKLDRIEDSINILHSRTYRETTYKSTIYSLLFATFIAIALTSGLNLMERIVPDKYRPFLTTLYYFLFIIAIGISLLLIEKMRENLDVDHYIAQFKVDGRSNMMNIAKRIRNIFSKRDHQVLDFKPIFEGIIVHNLFWYLNSRKTQIPRKEEIIKEKFSKETEKIIYNFEYVDRKKITSVLEVRLKEKSIEIEIDRGVEHKIAAQIFNDISKIKSLKLLDKSGWDH